MYLCKFTGSGAPPLERSRSCTALESFASLHTQRTPGQSGTQFFFTPMYLYTTCHVPPPPWNMKERATGRLAAALLSAKVLKKKKTLKMRKKNRPEALNRVWEQFRRPQH